MESVRWTECCSNAVVAGCELEVEGCSFVRQMQEEEADSVVIEHLFHIIVALIIIEKRKINVK